MGFIKMTMQWMEEKTLVLEKGDNYPITSLNSTGT